MTKVGAVPGLDEIDGLTLGGLLGARAAKYADKPCLLSLQDGRSWSYSQLDDAANRVANGLVELGCDPGDHVAIMTDNRPEQLISYFATARAGGVSIPVNTSAKGYFLERFLQHSDAKILLIEEEHLPAVEAIVHLLPGLQHLVLFDRSDGAPASLPRLGERLRSIPFGQLVSRNNSPIDRADPTALAQILYTSGTTGPSKGNMFAHSSLLNWARCVAAGKEITEDDTYMVVFPIFHGGGWLNATLSTLWAGGTVALGRKFSASRYWEQAIECGATKAIAISLTGILAAQPPRDVDRMHSIRNLYGAPPPPNLGAFEERFGVRLVGGYGLTDYGASHYTRPSDPVRKAGSVGRPLPGWQVRIADEQGREVPAGICGEILLRCDVPGGAALGYYKMPEETLTARRDMWHHTGDMGYVDEDDYLFFVDRKKDAIRRLGENISSIELEAVLRRCGGVVEAAFFPIAAPQEDEVAVAVVLDDTAGLAPEDIVRYCSENMPRFAIPRFILQLDAFPRTASGKVQKQLMRSQLENDVTAAWDRLGTAEPELLKAR